MTKSQHNHPHTAIVFLSPILEIGFGDSKLGVAKVNLSLNEKLVANDPGSSCSPVFLLKRLILETQLFLLVLQVSLFAFSHLFSQMQNIM